MPVTVTSLPETSTVTTPVRSASAAKVSASPSGSVKAPETSTVVSAPTATLWSGIAPEASGSRFTDVTATPKVCGALRPPGSVAVTVMVALPGATPVTVTVLPETLTVATPGVSEVAAKVSASPSGSVNAPETLTVVCASASTVTSGIVAVAVGARFAGGAGGAIGPGVPPSPPQAEAHWRKSTATSRFRRCMRRFRFGGG